MLKNIIILKEKAQIGGTIKNNYSAAKKYRKP